MLTRNKHESRFPAIRGVVAALLLALAPVVATLPVHAADTKFSADAAEWQQVQKQSAQSLKNNLKNNLENIGVLAHTAGLVKRSKSERS